MTTGLDLDVGRAFFGDFAQLRPVQTKAIPPIIAGADALVRAPTASGKTEAAIAPLVSRYRSQLQEPRRGVGILIVSPTRALVNDLHRRLMQPLDALGIRCGVRHGERNHLQLVEPPAVLLTTPESFDIEVGHEPDSFRHIRAVVLDEAHLLYNTQRGMQVAATLQRLEAWLGHRVQVVGLSATIGRSTDVWRFFRPGRTVEDISDDGGRGLTAHLRFDVSIARLTELLHDVDDKKVLVFTNSRRECDQLVDQLERSGLRCPTYAHHSSLAREAREATEGGFEAATSAICVATSTLELGIDIGSIDLVVLYGIPADWQSLAQRVGRGNRRRNSIEALLCTGSGHGEPDSITQLLGFQALLLQTSDASITDERPREIFGAVGQQLASWLVAGERFRGVNTLTKPFAEWPHLAPATVTSILDELAEHDVLKRHPAYHQYGPSEGAYELERTWDLWSNFTGAGRQVAVSASGAQVGRISARDGERLSSGDRFLLGGRRWRVTSKTMFDVEVRSTSAGPTIELRYGSGAPVEGPLHAEAIRRTLQMPVNQFCTIPSAGERDRLGALVGQLAPLAADGIIPTSRDPDSDGRYVYLTFAGALLNNAIARTMSDDGARGGQFLLESNAGGLVVTATHSLRTPAPLGVATAGNTHEIPGLAAGRLGNTRATVVGRRPVRSRRRPRPASSRCGTANSARVDPSVPPVAEAPKLTQRRRTMATKKPIHVTTEQTHECVEPGSGDGRVWRTVHLRPEGRSWWDSARPLRVRDIEIATEALPASGRRRVLKVGMAVDMARGERWDNVYFNLEELLPRMARDPDTRRIMAKAIAAALDAEARDIVRRANRS